MSVPVEEAWIDSEVVTPPADPVMMSVPAAVTVSVSLEYGLSTELADIHRAQVHNYLKATGHRLGLLVNFGNYPKLEWERIVR